jgi:hypothetical protein
LARKKVVVDPAFVLFDVIYEDGRRTSNRKVPSAEVGGLDGEQQTRAFLEAQDNKIAEMSGDPRGLIKSITRSAGN